MSIPTSPDLTETPIYNPMTHDFTWEYMDDENVWYSVIVPFGKISYYPKWMAEGIKRDMATQIYGERGYGKTPIEDMKKIITDEIEVSL